MTQDEIIEMARQAGFIVGEPWREILIVRFANAVAQHTLANIDPSKFISFQEGVETGRLAEREACLALRDHDDVLAPIGNSAWGEAYQDGWGEGTAAYWKAIKARGQA